MTDLAERLRVAKEQVTRAISRITSDEFRALAKQLTDSTERLNRSIDALEFAARTRRLEPRSTIVLINGRACVLQWNGQRLMWNGNPLRNASRGARIGAIEYLEEIIE